MTRNSFTEQDYPIAEKNPDAVIGKRGKSLDGLTLQAAVEGEVQMEDLRITPEALLQQAQIARSAGRSVLAKNFERAAEMTRLPQSEIMQIYELLRPGRAESEAALLNSAKRLRSEFEAPLLAAFVEEACALYLKRGLFRKRY